MADKVKLKYLGKGARFDYRFEEIETGEEILLKIWKDKEFINTLEEGEIGYGLFNQNWLNEWQCLQKPEKKENNEVFGFYSKEITPTPTYRPTFDFQRRGQILGGLMHDACALAAAEFEKNNDNNMTKELITNNLDMLLEIRKDYMQREDIE